MQTLANVLNMPILIVASDQQAPALGGQFMQQFRAGVYANVQEASKNMGSDYEAEYFPQPELVENMQNLWPNIRFLLTLLKQFRAKRKKTIVN